MSFTLSDHKGQALITDLSSGKKHISINAPQVFVPIGSCETGYPRSLIELIFQVKGADYLCDEICRDIDPEYLQTDLKSDLAAYFTSDEVRHKRILDFGCGSGASSMILSRMFPESEIVGVDLDQGHLNIARHRLEYYGYQNVQFFLSPSGSDLPPNIGDFDLVVMSAVYEHLLPAERTSVIPVVWSVVKPSGSLFLNLTPHRWFPIEQHTTGLPLINYLPARLALPFARTFSKRIDKTEAWETLLRRGIRGATEIEILNILSRHSNSKPALLEPQRNGLKDRIDLWFSKLGQERRILLKKAMKMLLKTVRAGTGLTLVPKLSVVFKKSA